MSVDTERVRETLRDGIELLYRALARIEGLQQPLWEGRAIAREAMMAWDELSMRPDPTVHTCETAVDRARREAERRKRAPTEPVLPVLPPCAPGCPCATCDSSRPEHEPDDLFIEPHHL